jgi:DNA polymerase-3 subunit epsilon
MITIFDTETSGFITPSYPPEHPRQGRVLQVGALLLDESFKEMGSFCFLLKQDENREIHPKAFEQHGLTIEQCNAFGVRPEMAILCLDSFLKNSQYHIGFNIKFDIKMMNYEDAAAFGGDRGLERLVFTNTLCLMEYTTPICKLPRPGFSSYKWPSLTEAYQHFHGELPPNAHDALDDCRYTAAILRKVYEIDSTILRPSNVVPIS